MPLCVWHHSKEKLIHLYITKQHRTRKQYDPFYKTRVLEFAEALKSHLFNLFERNGIRRIFIQVLCFIVGSVCCSGEDVLYALQTHYHRDNLFLNESIELHKKYM